MVFSSPVFLFLFLPIVLVVYLAAPGPLRNLLLLSCSLFFYAWGETFFVLVLLTSIGLNHAFGWWLQRAAALHARAILALAVAANLGLLAWFKYANFLAEALSPLLVEMGGDPIGFDPVHLPLGISFFTFQALSYVIDVYRGRSSAQKNPLNVALYISMFPQLVAGPIVRYRDIADQLVKRTLSLEVFTTGVWRFAIGLGKKILIADTLAVPVDGIFSIPGEYLTPGLAWLGAVGFTLQIYFDFSGYSDMAIGMGYMLGFRFRENFDHPYIARSLTGFWRRWHISLSTWFRDYLYVPLGGNRRGGPRTYLNLLIVFFLCGLWHGASWIFVLWGLYHGLFLVVERLVRGRTIPAALMPLAHAYTLLIVVVGWVLFRSETIGQAGSLLAAMAGAAEGDGTYFYPAMFLTHKVWLALLVGAIGSAPILSWLARGGSRIWAGGGDAPSLGREVARGLVSLSAIVLILLACAMQISVSTFSPFLYFRF